MPFDEIYPASRKFITQNATYISILVGLFFVYILLTLEEGFTNFAEYPAALSSAGANTGVKPPAHKPRAEEKIIPAPKITKQNPTQTMKKDSDYLAANRVDDANFMGSYTLLPNGMNPSNDFSNNSQLMANRASHGPLTGINNDMFHSLDGSPDSKGSPEPSQSSKKVSLKLIYAPWCGHSKRALPAFDKVMDEMNNTNIRGTTVIVEKHNSDESPDIVKQYDVKGFPHYLVEVSDGETVTKTVKVQTRDYEGLKKAITNNV